MNWISVEEYLTQLQEKIKSINFLIFDHSNQMYLGYLGYYHISMYSHEKRTAYMEISSKCSLEELGISEWMKLENSSIETKIKYLKAILKAIH